MKKKYEEQTNFLNYLLMGLIVFMALPMISKIFFPDPISASMDIVYSGFFILLYLLHKKLNNYQLTSNILIFGVYIIEVIEVNQLKAENFSPIWLLIVPLFAYLLLNTKQAFFYVLLTILTSMYFAIEYNENTTLYEDYVLLEFNIFLILILYLLSKSRQSAWLETQNHVDNLNTLVMEKTTSITDNYDKSLQAMIKMIEGRDTYTGGHSERVANYSKLIAEEMGLSNEECDLVYKAGILHDIGKIITPDNVLLKPGQLTDEEYGLIKQHVKSSHNILSQIPMYEDIADVVFHHHEEYDGTGYPNNVKGDQIPLLSRIMIIADAFDAMTTNRIYKGRKSVEESITEMKKLSGKQFDPEIVSYASKALINIDIEENISQLPVTTIDKARFNYFFRDHLTEAYNKEYLELYINNNIHNHDHPVIVFFLKNFTQYNEKHGWEAGDTLLKKFTKYLHDLIENDLAFRVHGDDFVILYNYNDNFKFEHPSFFENTCVEIDFKKSTLSNVMEDIN